MGGGKESHNDTREWKKSSKEDNVDLGTVYSNNDTGKRRETLMLNGLSLRDRTKLLM